MALDRTISNNGIVAAAGGGQADAVVLKDQAFNRVTTVATAADSVKLPAGVNGKFLWVVNSGANSMDVFPSTGETINALAADAAYAMAAGTRAMFFCPVNGAWFSVLSA